MKLGVQLFTVRKEAKSDLFGTLSQLKELGIRYIEAARIEFDDNNANTLKKAYEQLGTTVISSQIKYPILKDNFDEIVSFLKITNCNNAVISVLPTQYIIGNNDKLIEFCQDANNLAKKYKAEGISLCYHHHDYEFIKRKDGNIQFDILTKHLDSNVFFVIDTYWATKGGISSDKIISSLKGRVRGAHLRDYALVGAKRKPKDFALGDGVIDFMSIINTCKNHNVEYGVIEQKTSHPILELRKSVEHLKKLGFSQNLE